MLKIHHLNTSRSERIVWLAEELGLEYELVHHTRDPQTVRSPPSLFAVHPMGKAPVIEDRGKTIFESGAVVEYILDEYGAGRLRPKPGTDEFLAYRHWMHAAESTLIVPILLDLLGRLTGVSSEAYTGFTNGEYATTLGYLDQTLAKSPYVAGREFTGADVMVTYDLHLANGTSFPALKTSAPIEQYPNVVAYLKRVESRPAYRKMREICP